VIAEIYPRTGSSHLSVTIAEQAHPFVGRQTEIKALCAELATVKAAGYPTRRRDGAVREPAVVITDIVITTDERDAWVGDHGGLVPSPVGPPRVETPFVPRTSAAGWSGTSLDREQTLG
jgi:hypothetical protein